MFKRSNLSSPPLLHTLASLVNGTVHGDTEVLIHGLSPLKEATVDALAFYSGTRQASFDKLYPALKCAALLIHESLELPDTITTPLVQVADPQRAMLDLIPQFYSPLSFQQGISEKADIAESARLGDDVHVGAFSVIGNEVVIGNKVTIHPHVVIYPGAIIEDHCTIHSGAIIREFCHLKQGCVIQNGAIIGSDGFGYVPDPTEGLRTVPQVGVVVLNSRVDVGANSCIDRGALGDTRISDIVKVDNLVQIGHNVTIGTGTVVCGQSGISGSTEIGSRCVLGGSTGVGDHLTVVDDCRFAGRTGVIASVHEPGDYQGYPAQPIQRWRRQEIACRKLPQLLKEVRTLRKQRKESS